MAEIAVVFSSATGQTEKIAEYLARRIRDQGHSAECLDVRRLPPSFDIDNYEGVLVGAPVRMMKFPRSIVRFVRRYREALGRRRTGFFVVCMAAADTRAESREQIRQWVETFLGETGWAPTATAVFAGALMYTKYNFITRFVMKKISASEGRSTDTRRDHEYTNWDDVGHFADEFLAL